MSRSDGALAAAPSRGVVGRRPMTPPSTRGLVHVQRAVVAALLPGYAPLRPCLGWVLGGGSGWRPRVMASERGVGLYAGAAALVAGAAVLLDGARGSGAS